MTDQDRLSLFAEMDLRASNPHLRDALRDELQLVFREIQKRRMPGIDREQWLGLFDRWRDRYVAKRTTERDATFAPHQRHHRDGARASTGAGFRLRL